MKVLHLVSQDNGGAGRAALRLHHALLEKNIQSLVLVQTKTTSTEGVIRLAKTRFQKVMEKIRPAIQSLPLMFYPKRHQDIFSPNALSNSVLIKTIKQIAPNIIHLHWINNGFLNIKDLEKFKIPMIWSLHDSNPFTGGCHIVPPSCRGVQTHCAKCPFLHSRFSFDLSYWNFESKRKTYKNINLLVNGLSKWISQCAEKSTLLKDKKIINLPNPINTEVYKPIQKDIAKKILNINTSDKKIILFGAIEATSLRRKGYIELTKALETICSDISAEFVIFGSSTKEQVQNIKTHSLGHLNDDISLRLAYCAADVMVVPSLAENLSNTIIESLSCGTPVVAFDIGGNKDIIEHMSNGYLAKENDCNDLGRGIQWVLNLDSTSYETISQNARSKVLENFDSQLVAKQYIEIYNNILRGGGIN